MANMVQQSLVFMSFVHNRLFSKAYLAHYSAVRDVYFAYFRLLFQKAKHYYGKWSTSGV